MSANLDARAAAYGALLLRVASGLLFLLHGLYLKVFIFTMPGTVAFYESIGLPGVFAWLTVAGEVVGGLMLILGVHVRLASVWLIAILLGALWVHGGNGWLFTNANGGYEYPAFWAAVQGAILLLGPGAHALQVSLFGRKAPAARPAVA